MSFRTIVADPPWQYTKARQETYARGTAERHYPTLRVSEVEALPVAHLAADDAHLYLWVTNKILTEQRVDGTALGIVRAWGFEAKTILTWVKPQIGLGYYFRGSTEHVIFAVRGSLPVPPERRLRNVIEASRSRHSAKPERFFEMVVATSPGPRLEMFARAARPGWSVWGNEVDSDVALSGTKTQEQQ